LSSTERLGARLIDRRIAAGLPFAAASLCSALSALGAVVVLTRLLGAQGYGLYVTALAGIGVLQNALFFWLQTGVTRLHSRSVADDRPGGLADGTSLGFLLALVFACVGWIAVAALSLPDLERAWLPGVILLLARGWLGVAQAWTRVRGQIWRFVLAEAAQSLGGLALASMVLSWTGPDAAAALWACVAASLVAIALSGTAPPHTGLDRSRRPSTVASAVVLRRASCGRVFRSGLAGKW
jgi:O-antigen/teichoic acid export membrane protein